MAVEFTGRGLFLNTSDAEANRAFERLADQTIEGERFKYAKALQEEENFLKDIDVDPVQLASISLATKQQAAIDGFERKWAKIFKERSKSGGLTSVDRLNLKIDRELLEAQQADMKASSDAFVRDFQIIRTDTTGKYDKEAFLKGYDEFVKTGKYDPSSLRPTPVNPDKYFMNLKRPQWFTQTQETRVVKDSEGAEKQVTDYHYGTEEEGRKWIAANVLGNPRLAASEAEAFQKLPPQKQKEYLDRAEEINASAISDDDRVNPIVLYAQDRHLDVVMGRKKTDKPKSTTKSSGGYKVNGVKVEPASATKIRIGDSKYTIYPQNKIVSFSVIIPSRGVSVLNENGKIIPINNVSGAQKLEYSGYVKELDAFLFRVPSNTRSLFSGDNVLIKRSELNNKQYDDIPIITEDGKTKTIGEVAKVNENDGLLNIINNPPSKKK